MLYIYIYIYNIYDSASLNYYAYCVLSLDFLRI